MIEEIAKPFDIPCSTLRCESGFFVMLDISSCIDKIPPRYTISHDYEDDDHPVSKNRVFMDDGRIPNDLAFCRWMAVERGVIMMPNSLFYHKKSPYRHD